MSKAQTAKKSSSGGISLTFIVGSIVAWCKTPTFVGWAGAGKSLLVGLGTSFVSGVGAVLGALGGAGALALVGGLIGGKKGAVAGAIGGAVLGGIGGYGVGAYGGYTTVRDWLLEKDAAKIEFNQNAAKPTAFNSANTLVLTPKHFAPAAPKFAA